MTDLDHEPTAQTAGQEDHENVAVFRGVDAEAPLNPDPAPQGS